MFKLEAASTLSEFCKLYDSFNHNYYININSNVLDLLITNIVNLSFEEFNDSIFQCDDHSNSLQFVLLVNRCFTLYIPKVIPYLLLYNFSEANWWLLMLILNWLWLICHLLRLVVSKSGFQVIIKNIRNVTWMNIESNIINVL